MSWPARTHFGTGRDPVTNGRKGGNYQRPPAKRTREWLLGYQAGWRASERNYERAERTHRRPA